MDSPSRPVQKTSKKRTLNNADQDDGASPSPKKRNVDSVNSRQFSPNGQLLKELTTSMSSQEQLLKDLAATTLVDESSAETVTMPRSRLGAKPLSQEYLEDMFTPKPMLPRTDAEFEERYKALKISSWGWVTKHIPDIGSCPTVTVDLSRLPQLRPESFEYVNYIASCRPKTKVDDNANGDHDRNTRKVETTGGWENFVITQRSSIIFAILGKVLEIHVFGHEMFGSSDTQLKILRWLDLEMINADGFARQVVRASMINGFLVAHHKALPPNLLSSLQTIQNGFLELIRPLHVLPTPPSPFHQSLSQILLTAAKLSLDMRREPDTIYHITPISKNTVLDPRTTHKLNSADVYRAGLKREGHHQQIVRMAAWPLIDAYRKGSGRVGGKDEGIRVRRIGRAEAYVEWGVLRRVANPSFKEDLKAAAPNRAKNGLIRPVPKGLPRHKPSTTSHDGEDQSTTTGTSPHSPPGDSYRDHEPRHDDDSLMSGPSLREEVASRHGRWRFPSRHYLAPGIGILTCVLAAGSTYVLNEQLNAQVLQTAATFATEMAGKLGTLDDAVGEVVMKMVNEAGPSAVREFARIAGWG